MMNSKALVEELVRAGVSLGTVVRLDAEAPGPEHLRYVDLLHSQTASDSLPDAVVESSGQPFAYVVRRERLGGEESLSQAALEDMVRTLACRSDARYLCVMGHSSMDVYPISFVRSTPAKLVDAVRQQSPTWLELLSRSVPLGPNFKTKRADQVWVEDVLFRLLVEAARGVRTAVPQLSVEHTLALVGRALFFRFLVDRAIVTVSNLGDICQGAQTLEEVFSSSSHLTATCKWLDRTFNGDLLSLGKGSYEQLIRTCGDGISQVCWHLSNIQHRTLGGQLEFDWSGIRFRHVPVDVLSQVYEDFAHTFVPELAHQTSVHFTPRQLAEVVVDGVFSATRSAPLHRVKVLDPAVGGGVFLVLSFRRLVAETWRATGKRPGRSVIRSILNKQLRGLDINRDALNITALSLYLAALELDPKPSPISDLRFDKLIGTVLSPVDEYALEDEADGNLGSLSGKIRNELKSEFDVVLGNPPWTGIGGSAADALDNCLSELTREVAADPARAVMGARYGSPDIAFFLAASRWAKPSGALGFVVHARFLFQPKSAELRRVVFEGLRITGVMNFSALRQDKRLWPSNDAPFALMVAQNVRPTPEDKFYFISPRHESQLEPLGQFRIDPAAALPIPLRLVTQSTHAFKALYKGSMLGLDLVSRIRQAGVRSLREELDSLGLRLRSGYQTGVPKRRAQSTEAMQGLPLANLSMHYCVPATAPIFDLPAVQWARAREIYSGPLLLFRESPKLARGDRGALFAPSDVVFSESFMGLSFATRPDLTLFMDVLYILSYSDLLLYYTLLTSAKFGVERDSALQTDFEEFPMVSMETVAAFEDEVTELAQMLKSGAPDWRRIDQLAANLYGLSESDQVLIQDTLATELPFTTTQTAANAPVSDAAVSQFVQEFNRLIGPYTLEAAQREVIRPLEVVAQEGWKFLQIGASSAPLQTDDLENIASLTSVASSYWASELRLRRSNGSELLGRLNQSRYWTRTEARLAALKWLRRPNQH